MIQSDTVNKIMAYEGGEMDEEQVIEFFQEMVNSGLVWELQGSYGRMANNLLKAGLIRCPADGTRADTICQQVKER